MRRTNLDPNYTIILTHPPFTKLQHEQTDTTDSAMKPVPLYLFVLQLCKGKSCEYDRTAQVEPSAAHLQ